MDMIALALKGMGIDPAVIVEQAQKLGEAFVLINSKLDTIIANQTAIMTSMGLMAPPPSDEVVALIAVESQKYLEAHGGNAERTVQ
jgi:hypothetical protein